MCLKHQIPRFFAIAVVILREAVSRKKSIADSEKVMLNTEGTFAICMPCYENKTATTKGFWCSTYVIHIFAAKG